MASAAAFACRARSSLSALCAAIASADSPVPCSVRPSVPSSVAPTATAEAEEGGASDALRRLSRQVSGALALVISQGVPEAEPRAEETHSVPLPPELHRILTKFDDRLLAVLEAQAPDLRLLLRAARRRAYRYRRLP